MKKTTGITLMLSLFFLTFTGSKGLMAKENTNKVSTGTSNYTLIKNSHTGKIIVRNVIRK